MFIKTTFRNKVCCMIYQTKSGFFFTVLDIKDFKENLYYTQTLHKKLISILHLKQKKITNLKGLKDFKMKTNRKQRIYGDK